MSTGLQAGMLEKAGRLIVDGGLPAGTVITLAELGERLNVSRTVAREIVKVLESMQMVRSRRRVGVTVLPQSQWDALDATLIQWRLTGPGRERQLRALMELRVAVEPTAAALTASRADRRVGDRLVQLAQRLDELGRQGRGRDDEYLGADIEFHTLLLDSCGNEMIAALKHPIVEVLSWRSHEGLTPAEPAIRALEGHTTLARAILARDTVTAEHSARAYLDEILHEVTGQDLPTGGRPGD